MDLGINAGFGDPVTGEFPFFQQLGIGVVRQDLFAHGEDAPIEALVAEFANQPTKALFMLAGGKVQVPDGSNRVEPHILAARGRRVVVAAQAVGLHGYSLEVGNEPDIAHIDYASRPQDFAEAIRMVHMTVRPLGFDGNLITGGVSNLNQRGLEYLRAMLSTTVIPDDVVLGFHRYPEAGRGAVTPHKGFVSRDDEFQALERIRGDRRVACTEFGYHTAEDRMGMFARRRRSDVEVADSVQWDLDFFAQRGVLLAAVYQLRDGDRDVPEERYGIRRVDGTLKPVADALIARSRKRVE